MASDVLEVIAATVPPKMATPERVSVVINNAQNTVTIQWSSGADDGGSTLRGFNIRRNSGFNTAIVDSYNVNITDPSLTQHSYVDELLVGVTYEF